MVQTAVHKAMLYIDGAWVAAPGGTTFDVSNPATGEVIGQVASQTLENMTTIAEVSTLEVLRPLVGMDKDEIVAEAERLGTFPISIIPDQDCCQLFTPAHPATKVTPRQIEEAERLLPIDQLVDAAVSAAEVEEFRRS
jgi:thiamine biosynthesis protein ThiI